ncbi:MAG TPA: hypothetical protein VKK79_16375 [Candidatus Lokiarchaeia archaeon]|nr:hypothetical protein [Candidatus Lokiarchaeia archaeon]
MVGFICSKEVTITDVVRACHKCREYVPIGDSYPEQAAVRAFDGNHAMHPVQTVADSEVRTYRNVGERYGLRHAPPQRLSLAGEG